MIQFEIQSEPVLLSHYDARNRYGTINLQKDKTELYEELVNHAFESQPELVPVEVSYRFREWKDVISPELRKEMQGTLVPGNPGRWTGPFNNTLIKPSPSYRNGEKIILVCRVGFKEEIPAEAYLIDYIDLIGKRAA